MRFFNTAGPCDKRFHYMLPAAERLPRAPRLVDRGGYFVVHAPRQTGKTTSLRALARDLTAQGKYTALRFSCETAEAAGDDYGAAERLVLASIARGAGNELPDALQPPQPWPDSDPGSLLAGSLRAWARVCPRPLVLFFDEIDALWGQSLISVLRQLRDLYSHRPDNAPWAVVLCGLRDVRDYKAASGGDPARLGSASPFNVKVKSVRLGDFDLEQIAALYRQHTGDTGQPFTDEAVARAFALTRGQPWLVNALASEIVDEDEMAIVPPQPITVEHVEIAKERLILARATHLDSLAHKLHDPRVRPVIEAVMAGSNIAASAYDDDVGFVRDLGLLSSGRSVAIANPIYREVIARVLAEPVEQYIQHEPGPFVAADGRLDLATLLHAFADFWRQHGEIVTGSLRYHEVAPQLVLMAFLQRIVNGGGFIDREYGLGRGRIDLLLRWPYADSAGQRLWQREALELKVWRDKQPDPALEGLAQLDGYLQRLSLEHGFLLVFDRRATGSTDLADGISVTEMQSPAGRRVTLWRL